ncbi:hypothetical protein J3R83DRAFT_8563 [Lanmaoa asiatica]|nr:hypothetical protein J3R83DRAFT_8563 [Lanmaoa asiatica]
MLPISEFHFAFCGIATVAATLGYACARRAVLSLASPNESSKADVEAGPPEERSLKRKLDDSNEHDVNTEEQSRPMKRNRTPPIDQHESDEDVRGLHPFGPCVHLLIKIKSNQEWEVIVAPPPYEQAASLPQQEEPVRDNNAPLQGNPHIIEQGISTIREVGLPSINRNSCLIVTLQPTPPARLETSSQPEEKGVDAGRCTTPQPPQISLSPNEPGTPLARPITPLKPAPPAKIEPVNAFSVFSGSSSPFASYSNASGASPFTLSGQIVKTTPAWRRDNESESDVFARASSANALAPSLNDAVSSATTKSLALSQSKRALGVSGEMHSLAKSSSYLTGEEDEDVEAELKGVKLFVKRGRKEFTDGMYGHIKILAQKSTSPKFGNGDPQGTEDETNSRTRLLFRRDPLGQVSMNVGLHPTVRCHFDSAEHILRIIMMEQMMNGKNPKEDIVIYALKLHIASPTQPGRAQKADFQSFVKTLCDHEGLKSRAVASSSSPASGDAAAS